MSREAKILTAILVVVVGGLVGLFVVMNGGTDSSTSSDKVDTKVLLPEGVHNEGTGSVQLVEFGDYQCGPCGALHPGLKKLKQEFGANLNFVFRNLPLTTLHKNALAAAQAAEAARMQSRFWEMHDLLYENQDALEDEYLARYAAALGLDAERLIREVLAGAHTARVREDFRSGAHLGVNGTPSFFINGVRYDGGPDVEELLTALTEQPPRRAT